MRPFIFFIAGREGEEGTAGENERTKLGLSLCSGT